LRALKAFDHRLDCSGTQQSTTELEASTDFHGYFDNAAWLIFISDGSCIQRRRSAGQRDHVRRHGGTALLAAMTEL
jgi:hypothetical protein